MINGLDLTTILLALYFVTPGIVTITVRDLTVASPERNWGAKIFGLITYSAGNLLLYQVLLVPTINAFYSLFHLSPVLNVPSLIASKSIDFGSVFWLSFLLPAFVGWLIGTLPKYNWFRRCFPFIQHPQPTAWDFLFAGQKQAYTLIFYLKSGEKIAGIYEQGGYVSAFPLPKEIYLTKQCVLDDKGVVQGVDENRRGVFIVMEECTHMEVFPHPSVERKSLWQKIALRIPQLLSIGFRKLRNANKRPSNARDMVRLFRQTPASTRLGEAESSPSPNQLPEALERSPQPHLRPQPPVHRAELPQPPAPPAREELLPPLPPLQPALPVLEESRQQPLQEMLPAKEEPLPPPAPIPATKTEEAQ